MKNKLLKSLSVIIAAAVLLTPFAALAKTDHIAQTAENNIVALGHEIYEKGENDGDRYYYEDVENVKDYNENEYEYNYQISYFGDEYCLNFYARFNNDNDYIFFSYTYPTVKVEAGVYSESDASQYATAQADMVVYSYDFDDLEFTVKNNVGELKESQINNKANINLRCALKCFNSCLSTNQSAFTLGNLGFVNYCEHVYSTSYIPATTSAKGAKIDTCKECGFVKSSNYAAIGKITLSTSAYSYDGKVKKPSVKVLDKDGKTIAASNYTVSYQSGRKNIGRYWVKVKFNGKKYKGEKKLYFTIGPKGTSISSISPRSKGFYVKWKKQAKSSNGYQIQYATDSKFTKDVKTVTVSKTSTVSKTISKLKAKKTYYVRVRTYKTVSGNKCYSAWSGSKKVTTKK